MDEKDVRALLRQRREHLAEYNYLQSCIKRNKSLCSEQTQRMCCLEEWLACIDSVLMALNEDERFVIQRHLLDEIDWNRIISEYESKWGTKNGRCRRTLIRYQRLALSKLARNIKDVNLPDII